MCLRASRSSRGHAADGVPGRSPCSGRLVVDTAGMKLRRNPGTAVSLVIASHPVFALAMALGVAGAAASAGRAWREVGLVAVTILVGRMTAGWLNDVADR